MLGLLIFKFSNHYKSSNRSLEVIKLWSLLHSFLCQRFEWEVILYFAHVLNAVALLWPLVGASQGLGPWHWLQQQGLWLTGCLEPKMTALHSPSWHTLVDGYKSMLPGISREAFVRMVKVEWREGPPHCTVCGKSWCFCWKVFESLNQYGKNRAVQLKYRKTRACLHQNQKMLLCNT